MMAKNVLAVSYLTVLN